MNQNAQIYKIARRVVWWKTPEETLKDEIYFLAHVMNSATWEDAMFVFEEYGRQSWTHALNQAPPGVINAKSWAFWHRWLNLPVPPMPRRHFGVTG